MNRTSKLGRVGVMALGLALGLGGCGEDSPVASEATRIAMSPHPVFQQLWADVQLCSNRTGDFGGIRWFVTTAFDSADTLGQWNSRREITIRIDSWNNFLVIKHELLHDLLGGDGDHRDPAWVNCEIPTGQA